MTSDRTQTARATDIAVIGMAVRLPEADDLQEFLANLREGRDSVRELSAERRSRTSLAAEAPYQLNGYIEDIDSFDHAYFGISRGEAQNMAPEHRLLLQAAHQAIENAGYDPADLRGTRAAVYIGDTRLMYGQLARRMQPTMVMGTHPSATAGRISRYFGLRGAAAMIDSSCSSALLAVRHAVSDLVLGDAELALVGGVSLNLFAEPKHEEDELDLGIRSADGKTRAFSADADGTGSGEAVACVLLKPLAQALRDGDPVQAVIKGIAANNVAGRSSTLTAPDSAAQAEVIEQAWEKAGVEPDTVSYIEAHGTATRLGDPIEIAALDRAFARATGRKGFCDLSSVKSNIGHTWSASGLVGLVKAVLALRSRQLFPSVHAGALSPLIDWADSAVTVTQQLRPWKPEAGVRRAGVSSFGVMGTNVHAVLEEAPAVQDRERADRPGGHWLPVSAASPTALAANVAALRRWLEDRPELRIEDVQRTLVGGRGHHPYRACVSAGDLREAVSALTRPQVTGPDEAAELTVLVVSGRCTASPALTETLSGADPHFADAYREAVDAAGAMADDPPVHGFAFQYAMHGVLRRLGVDFQHVVGEGVGKLVLDVHAGRLGLAEAVRRLDTANDASAAGSTDLQDRVQRMLDTLTGGRRALFVEAGPMSTVSRALSERTGNHTVVALEEKPDAFAAFLRDLYLHGANWSWTESAGPGNRVELPGYQFDRIRCWLDEANLKTPQGPATEAPAAGTAAENAPTDAPDVAASVLTVWTDVLGLDAVDQDASFFDLGGDSISGTQVLNRLQSLLGVELDPFAIFDHETPRELSAHIEAELALLRDDTDEEPVVNAIVSVDEAPAGDLVAHPAEVPPFPASPAQFRIWLASQLEGGSVAFNLTRSFALTGDVDVVALRRALDEVAARHDGLRAVFAFCDEELIQTLTPRHGFTVPLELVSHPRSADAEPAERASQAREFAARPFDLEQGPLLRAQLVSFGDGEHLLTLSTHHIVADGWSLGLLVRDLGACYSAFARGATPALPQTAADYVTHHRQEAARAAQRRDEDANYWRGRFREEVQPLSLPSHSVSETVGFTGAYRNYALPEDLWQEFRDLGRTCGGTAFTSVLAAFAAVFSSCSERGDLVLGTSIAGRNEQSLEQLIAMLVRTLPLRLLVDGRHDFRTLHEHVRTVFGEALRHADHPYEELVQELQQSGLLRSPHLFDVLIEFEQFSETAETPLKAMAEAGVSASPVEVVLDTSVNPLNIMLAEYDGTLHAAVRFDARLFDAPTVDRLWSCFTALVSAVVAAPQAPLKSCPVLAEPGLGWTGTPSAEPTAIAPSEPPAADPRSGSDGHGHGGDHDGAPRTANETALQGIWRDVLGVAEISRNDRFFDLGGNSLRAIKVMARIHDRFGVKPTLQTLFSHPTIAELAEVLAQTGPDAADTITALGGTGDYEAGRTQELLLEIERTSPQRGAFHRNDLHELRGPLDPALLEHAFAQLAARHESLRTTYTLVDGHAVQTVRPVGALLPAFTHHDLTDRGEQEVRDFVAGQLRRPFEIDRESLVRADLIRIGEDRHLLATSMHQLISDGRSAQVLLRDWHELYEAAVAERPHTLTELTIQYKDVAAWRNRRLSGGLLERGREFWIRELAGTNPHPSLPADLPRPTVSALAGVRLQLPLSATLAGEFAALAHRCAVTEFVLARTAVSLLLAGAGNPDFVVGAYSLGRSKMELEDQIGFHINTVPLRFRLRPQEDVRTLLTRAQGEVLKAFQHEEHPYSETMRELGWKRGPERSPVFDVVVALDQLDAVAEGGVGEPSVEFVPQQLPRRSKEADLQFSFLRSAGRLELALTYNTEVFSAGRAQEILGRLQALLEDLVTERPLAEILRHGEFDR